MTPLPLERPRWRTTATTFSPRTFKHERRNDGVTEIVEIEGRGHSLTIDSGWREVCEKALAFVKRFV